MPQALCRFVPEYHCRAGKSGHALALFFLVVVLSVSGLAFPEIGRAEKAGGIAADSGGGVDLLGAVRETIEHHPAIRGQREQVKLARGAHRSSGGDFDWRLETFHVYRRDHAPIPGADSFKSREQSESGIRFSKLLRSGVSVEPFLDYTENSSRFMTDDPGQEQKVGKVGLLFRVPMLRGLGYENTAAGEIAAALKLEAAQLNLAHQISLSVRNTTQAFWEYLAAYKRLAVLREAEERAQAILDNTETLVMGGEVAVAELVNVRANLADKERARLTAAQAVAAARAVLGLAMGIPAVEIHDLPEPHGVFPELDSTALLQAMTVDIGWYSGLAARHRLDLLAAGRENEALKADLRAARNRVKPALNLEFSLGYDGVESGSNLSRSPRALEYNQNTPDWSTGVRLSYPLGNNRGRGDLEQALARSRQGELREHELFRAIQTDISLVRSELLSIYQQLERAEEAVNNYTTAVANEWEKYLMGETTLLDLLNIEERLDNALLTSIAVRQQAAVALAKLRFETGRLVRVEEGEGMVTHADLTTMLLPGEAESL